MRSSNYKIGGEAAERGGLATRRPRHARIEHDQWIYGSPELKSSYYVNCESAWGARGATHHIILDSATWLGIRADIHNVYNIKQKTTKKGIWEIGNLLRVRR